MAGHGWEHCHISPGLNERLFGVHSRRQAIPAAPRSGDEAGHACLGERETGRGVAGHAVDAPPGKVAALPR